MFHKLTLFLARIGRPWLREIMHNGVDAQLIVSTFKITACDGILNQCLPRCGDIEQLSSDTVRANNSGSSQ